MAYDRQDLEDWRSQGLLDWVMKDEANAQADVRSDAGIGPLVSLLFPSFNCLSDPTNHYSSDIMY